METFMFVLDRDTTLGAYNEPLKFFNLSADSVECASLTDNVLKIRHQNALHELSSFHLFSIRNHFLPIGMAHPEAHRAVWNPL